MTDTYTRYTVVDHLDKLMSAKATLIRREIDVSTCRTRYDSQQLRKAEESFEETQEEVIQAILDLIEDARRRK